MGRDIRFGSLADVGEASSIVSLVPEAHIPNARQSWMRWVSIEELEELSGPSSLAVGSICR